MADFARKRPASVPENILEDIKAVLVGADGTITPRSFAKDTLLNYLRENLKAYLEESFDADEVQSAIEELRKQAAEDSSAGVEGVVAIPDKEANQADVVDAVVGSVLWLLNSGRKTTALRHLQCLVWCNGFRTGQILGSVNDDVAQVFDKLTQDNLKIYVYSSLGVETQRLVLRFSNHGDLSDISGYFDLTTAGMAVEKESYANIATSIQVNPENILYITAHATEVTAASAAGLKTCLMVREKDEESKGDEHSESFIISTFADLLPEDDIPAKRMICPGDIVGVDDGSFGSDGKGTSDDVADTEAGDESPVD